MVSPERLRFPTNTKKKSTTMFQRFALNIGGSSKRRNNSTTTSRINKNFSFISNHRKLSSSADRKDKKMRRLYQPQPQLKQYQYNNIICKPLKLKPKHRGNELAIVACGNFWTPQYRFSNMHGVIETTTGYIGGSEELQPTHHDIYDYTEAVCIEYDPTILGYEDVLRMWRDNDDPFTRDLLRYRSAVFVLSEYQYIIAKRFMNKIQNERPDCYLFTDIEWVFLPQQEEEMQRSGELPSMSINRGVVSPIGTASQQPQQLLEFHIAEDMHQDYVVKEWEMAQEHLMAWANEQTKSGLFPICE